MTRGPKVQAVEAILALLGAPAPPRDLWTNTGVCGFVRDWSANRPGSIAELRLLLRLGDPHVQVETRSLDQSDIHVLITWGLWPTTSALLSAGAAPYRLAAAARQILEWWCPFGLNLTWDMTWPGIPLLAIPLLPTEELMMSTESKLVVKVAEGLLGVRRRPARPPMTWIGLETTRPLSRSRHEMRLANPRLDRFLVNTRPWRASVHIEKRAETPGLTELHVVALRRSKVLELLVPAGRLKEVRLDGQLLRAFPLSRWPEYWRFRLKEPLEAGRVYQVVCAATDAEPIRVWVNPALFEAARYEARRRSYVAELEAHLEGADAFPDLIAGSPGIVAHYQPFPLTAGIPAESDEQVLARARYLMLGRHIVRRTDLDMLLYHLVPDIADVTCRDGEWAEECNGWRRTVRGVDVRLIPAEPARTQYTTEAARRFLTANLGINVATRVRVYGEAKT